jgi:hypothetical protein
MAADRLKLKKITDTNYLIIINETYTLKNKSYEKGQCVKMINNYMVHTFTQDEVDKILTTTIINRIIIDKGISTRKDLALKRNKNGEIRNKKVIILPDKDDDEKFQIISVDCFFIDICDFSWYKIKSQNDLDILLNKNRIDNTLQFGYYENTETVEIENQRLIRNQYNSSIMEEQVLLNCSAYII